jgi:hypothetical protein
MAVIQKTADVFNKLHQLNGYSINNRYETVYNQGYLYR